MSDGLTLEKILKAKELMDSSEIIPTVYYANTKEFMEVSGIKDKQEAEKQLRFAGFEPSDTYGVIL